MKIFNQDTENAEKFW